MDVNCFQTSLSLCIARLGLMQFTLGISSHFGEEQECNSGGEIETGTVTVLKVPDALMSCSTHRGESKHCKTSNLQFSY